ncbi:Mu-like prophage major head subunit gpT family protein [Vibrio parahaemolyticus]|uniref:Mu-like prophage major head subunit gpT family protein n=1 Tax=Vibrio parahaemolyticus TaxID=670 RepID=UPI000DFA8B54|nr:Mu-like prophage major head subunit gpT family protein [Vibrio parahaemolyticus]EJG1710626.1 Mu-like prophage major head subunit gpT family protein [Vibrio parahaemolyticus]EJG1744003.1 Mu-like prophage major head subunit gpT family protein [Vibrio parahaemolyticus]EJG1781716.1 Mu-like prophage major head subunit gpT family protein [Vibrio parahaemolyticus]SUP22765.1 Mu-like prophage FluMu major head subunit [Vibrio parahaemolyticus]
MKTSGANLSVLYTAVKTNFQIGRQTYTQLWPKIATLVPSTTAVETYAWLGEFTRLREWIGERQINRMKAHGYTLANKKFEGTEAIGREYVEDDTYGVLMPKFQDMGYAAATHPDEMTFALLLAGFDNPCYDGQNFFDTDHPVGDEGQEASVSNMQAGSGAAWFLLDTTRPLKPLIYQQRKDYNLNNKTDASNSDHVYMMDEFLYGVDARGNWGFGFWQQAFASKADLTEANFDTAMETMMGFKSDKGRPLGIMPNLLIVGPTNRSAGQRLIEVLNKDGGGSNPNYKAVELLVVPWLP